MNLHLPSVMSESPRMLLLRDGKLGVLIGGASLCMSRDEARVFAQQLLDAAGAADPLVKLEGLQASNEDLSSEHATLGKPA